MCLNAVRPVAARGAAGSGCHALRPMIEEPFDFVTQLIDARTERWRVGAMIERADVGIGTLSGDFRAQCGAVITTIPQQNAVNGQRDSGRPKSALLAP